MDVILVTMSDCICRGVHIVIDIGIGDTRQESGRRRGRGRCHGTGGRRKG